MKWDEENCIRVINLFHLCFFFNDTATTEIYTLSLHDALPISAESFAQKQGTDIVYLKNGSVIRGTIIEHVVGSLYYFSFVLTDCG